MTTTELKTKIALANIVTIFFDIDGSNDPHFTHATIKVGAGYDGAFIKFLKRNDIIYKTYVSRIFHVIF